MQLATLTTITCPNCQIKQPALIKTAQTDLFVGDKHLRVGEKYMLCRFVWCGTLIKGDALSGTDTIKIKGPGDLRKALQNQLNR